MPGHSQCRLRRSLGALASAVWLLIAAPPLAAQPVPAKESPEETCKGCHEPHFDTYLRSKHGTKADKRSPANSGACLVCHGQGALEHAQKGGGRGVGGVVNPGAKTVPANVKNATCLSCHQDDPRRLHWDGSVHSNRNVACTSCHQVHAKQDRVRDKATQFEVCFNCHKEQRVQINKPYRHPILEGKVACSDCHNVHGNNPKQMERGSVVETCYQCHMEKRGPFVHNHQPVTEDCTLCHQPHGTTIVNLLKTRPPFLCQECHASIGGGGSHPVQLAGVPRGRTTSSAQLGAVGRGCLNCHTNIHGSNSTQNSATSGRFRR
jgi:DmsE family decaheme c-type cytochrome